ncbi:hypothetical protein RHMOL_Rhmol02G0079500 [Rhododendron molle]|uniref:Uncharacterized protein n=1 Tax=Rhododendron molle TaxID=49168 RepID=A0ACC0PMK1_RHOML|nr:hypothetical protein RHMOL_Rhmol02G0079500 [Rhododendron molle]
MNNNWRKSVFLDICDVERFKRTLQADVRVVSSLPSTHLVSRQTIGSNSTSTPCSSTLDSRQVLETSSFPRLGTQKCTNASETQN